MVGVPQAYPRISPAGRAAEQHEPHHPAPVPRLFQAVGHRCQFWIAAHQHAGRRTLRCLQFGLVHAVVGIPIGVALALSVGGAYFMWAYLRGYRRADTWPREAALLESTRAHLAYNGVIVVLVLGAIGLWLVTG